MNKMYCKIDFVKKILFCLFLMVGLSALYAQSAEVVTEILNTSKVTYGQVCYLSAVHQNLVSENATYEESISAIYNAKQIEKEYDASKPVNLEKLAYLYMKMWPKQKGGIMYRLSGGSQRYCFKLLKDYGIITARGDPWQYVSGREALNILTACMMEFDSVNEGMALKIENTDFAVESPVPATENSSETSIEQETPALPSEGEE